MFARIIEWQTARHIRSFVRIMVRASTKYAAAGVAATAADAVMITLCDRLTWKRVTGTQLLFKPISMDVDFDRTWTMREAIEEAIKWEVGLLVRSWPDGKRGALYGEALDELDRQIPRRG